MNWTTMITDHGGVEEIHKTQWVRIWVDTIAIPAFSLYFWLKFRDQMNWFDQLGIIAFGGGTLAFNLRNYFIQEQLIEEAAFRTQGIAFGEGEWARQNQAEAPALPALPAPPLLPPRHQ